MSFNENTVTKTQQDLAQKAVDSIFDCFQLKNVPKYVIKGLNSNEEIVKLEYQKFGKNGKEIKKIENEIKSIRDFTQNFVKIVFEFNNYCLKKMIFMSDIIKTTRFFTPRYMWTGVLDFPIPSSLIFGRVCKIRTHGGGDYHFAPYDTQKDGLIDNIKKIEEFNPSFFPYDIIEFEIFIKLLSVMKFDPETVHLLRMMPNKIRSNEKTTSLVDALNQEKEIINNLKKIPHFGTTQYLMSKFISDIDVSTIFIPYKEATYFHIDQFTYPPKKHCRGIFSLLDYLEENFRPVL